MFPAEMPAADGSWRVDVWWRVLALVAVGLGLLGLRACERYTSEYQSLPVVDWLESRPPLADPRVDALPAAADLARGLARTAPLLTVRDDARPYVPGLGPPSLSRRTIGGVRDAAVIEVGTPEAIRPRGRVMLHVAVFFRSLRAAAWTSLLEHEFDLRDPGTGSAQLRLTGSDATDRVWVTHPGDTSAGGEATVVGVRGPVAFQVQALAAANTIDLDELLDRSARAERLVRQVASDWIAWLEQQPSLRQP
jgi:hypothetical protein